MNSVGAMVEPVGERAIDDICCDVEGFRITKPCLYEAWNRIVMDV